MKVPHVFISHAWAYNHQYYNLLNLLNNRSYFKFYNHSVPEHDPLDFKTVEELRSKLRNQMRTCQTVIVLAGVYASYREWIQEEIEMAVEWDKPIIGIRPWGSTNISNIVRENATEIVRWNTESIVDAIRRHT